MTLEPYSKFDVHLLVPIGGLGVNVQQGATGRSSTFRLESQVIITLVYDRIELFSSAGRTTSIMEIDRQVIGERLHVVGISVGGNRLISVAKGGLSTLKGAPPLEPTPNCLNVVTARFWGL